MMTVTLPPPGTPTTSGGFVVGVTVTVLPSGRCKSIVTVGGVVCRKSLNPIEEDFHGVDWLYVSQREDG